MISTFVSYKEANTITPKQLCAEELDTIRLEKKQLFLLILIL